MSLLIPGHNWWWFISIFVPIFLFYSLFLRFFFQRLLPGFHIDGYLRLASFVVDIAVDQHVDDTLRATSKGICHDRRGRSFLFLAPSVDPMKRSKRSLIELETSPNSHATTSLSESDSSHNWLVCGPSSFFFSFKASITTSSNVTASKNQTYTTIS